MKHFLESVPIPTSLSYLWSFGSLLGTSLTVQLMSGLFLSFHYSTSLWGEEGAFESVINLEEVSLGWILRSIHANGASFFFILLFLHVARGLYYGSFSLTFTWLVGVMILLVSMGVAFLGYVLPWGQMSLWAATVITNLLSSLPNGVVLVEWVWGGFSVSNPTLIRFFSLHFILPFVILFAVLVHLFFLHERGSGNPLGLTPDSDKVAFHPLFSWKDVVGLSVYVLSLSLVCLQSPFMWMDCDNFTPANPLVTPEHIQPEWYFLFAYAILRSIPTKLGGVVALVSSILILALIPLYSSSSGKKWVKKILFWTFSFCFMSLTWLGSMPAEGVLIVVGKFLSFVYFLSLVLFTL